jgi:hypothetical protein
MIMGTNAVVNAGPIRKATDVMLFAIVNKAREFR